ncbi:UNVERIFIED_CONTAM: hypothetical protein PYX00_007905 [Menopon gallinae]
MWCQRIISQLKGYRYYSQHTSTIYALSSGQGKCGVAVIRVSGSKAANAILKMTDPSDLPKPRMAALKYVHDPVTKEKLDRGLILWFPGPKSFTGEDCCEFQVHGGPAVVSSILTALGKLDHFRPAEAGEFTRRAFFNEKLDLTEIEGLADLIHAETDMQRKQALLQMEGTLSNLYNQWRKTLLQNVAHVEAYVDFSEDENIEEDVLRVANEQLLKVKIEIENHLADGRRGERLRDGVKAVIIGEPNAGKSSLFNTLSNRQAAIVTPIAGTTRDLIELHININGYPLTLTDTAGLRSNTCDIIEIEGISRAHNSVKSSDLVLFVIDSTIITKKLQVENNLIKALNEHVSDLNLAVIDEDEPYTVSELCEMLKCIFLFNKTDLLSPEEQLNLIKVTNGENINCVSCATGYGFPLFIENLTTHLKDLCGCPSAENPTLTQIRHRHHLSQCCYYLSKYFTVIKDEDLPLAAHQIRKSLTHLGKITGQVSSDEILNIIFKDFCIGK